VRDEVVDYVRHWSERAGLPTTPFVRWIGIRRSKYYDWRTRYGEVNEHNTWIPRDSWLEEWEKRKIEAFAQEHPLEGYRRLTYMMMDADVVAASPSTVYRVLREADVLQRWNRKPSKKGQGFQQPLKSHEHWHVDVSYVNVCGTFYYLCSLLDGYSRFIVHWEIREQMTERDVEIVVQRAREAFPEARPRIISDNGPQFVAKDFKEFIRLSGMTHVRTSPYYPQSNGKLERFHGTLKQECLRPGTPLSVEEARRLVAQFVAYYNEVRLHSALKYVSPKAQLEARAEAILAERDRKLVTARERRRERRAQTQKLLDIEKGGVQNTPAGQTDAGSAGEQPARDSRSGDGDTSGGAYQLPQPVLLTASCETVSRTRHDSENAPCLCQGSPLNRKVTLSNSR